MKTVSIIVAAIVGGITGAIAGLIGDSFSTGFFSGLVSGGIVGFLFSLAPRSVMDPPIVVESFSPAGFVGGLVGSLSVSAGLVGTFISCGVGWVLGLLLPAILTGLLIRTDE